MLYESESGLLISRESYVGPLSAKNTATAGLQSGEHTVIKKRRKALERLLPYLVGVIAGVLLFVL